MDSVIITDLIKMIVFLPLILFLIIVFFKYGGKYLENLNNGKIIKVYERVPLSQKTFLVIVKVGDKPYLMTTGENGAQILLELDESLLTQYQTNQKIDNNFIELNFAKYLDMIKGKVKNEKV